MKYTLIILVIYSNICFAQNDKKLSREDSVWAGLAISLSDELIKKDSSSAYKSYRTKGDVHAGLGKYSSAIEFYKKAIKLGYRKFGKEELGDISQKIGTCYFKLSELDSSMFFYETSLNYDPTNFETFKYYNYVAKRCGDTTRVIDMISQIAVHVDREQKVNYMIEKSKLETKMKKYDDALISINAALEIDSTDSKALSQYKLIQDKKSNN